MALAPPKTESKLPSLPDLPLVLLWDTSYCTPSILSWVGVGVLHKCPEGFHGLLFSAGTAPWLNPRWLSWRGPELSLGMYTGANMARLQERKMAGRGFLGSTGFDPNKQVTPLFSGLLRLQRPMPATGRVLPLGALRPPAAPAPQGDISGRQRQGAVRAVGDDPIHTGSQHRLMRQIGVPSLPKRRQPSGSLKETTELL